MEQHNKEITLDSKVEFLDHLYLVKNKVLKEMKEFEDSKKQLKSADKMHMAIDEVTEKLTETNLNQRLLSINAMIRSYLQLHF